MNNAIEKGHVGEWALQAITADMETDEESRDTITTRTEDSVRGPVVQRVAGKKKIQERPLADYLDHENKKVVLHHIRDFISVNTSAIHQALPFYVLKELGLVAGMHTAKEYSMGLTLQFNGFAVIEKRERHTAVGRVPENGKTCDQGRQRPDGTPDRE